MARCCRRDLDCFNESSYYIFIPKFASAVILHSMKRKTKVFSTTLIVIVALNLIPFKTGPRVIVSCGMEHHTYTLTVLGLPFGYLQNSTHTGCGVTLIKQGHSVFKINDKTSLAYDNYYFKTSAFISDAVIGLAVFAVIYLIVRQSQKISIN